MLRKNNIIFLRSKTYFDFITEYPERILPVTFFLLCLTGGILLYLPISSPNGVPFLDALFTSVSGVCVTGLSVIDVGVKLTFIGQVFLILLIQSGGLGIMSITSIILILLGKRMSLSQEKTARNIFDAESKEDIKRSLITIFKYTFIVEAVGAFILACNFAHTEHNIFTGIGYGIFTSISAFCNAGFFLKGDNLASYYNCPIITYTVSFLIILGGMSPFISISLQKLFKNKKLPPLSFMVLTTTLILLFGGALFFLISEYNGVLSDLTFIEKINNAWFQATSPRTAGFNTVDLCNINMGTYILLITLMIIGGSPGGTAGGIKTSTLAVLILTCYNSIRGRDNIIRKRNITFSTLQKALTLTIIYLSIIVVATLMLFTTQSEAPHKLAFEVVSALGTVGLSMGATSSLDSIGKMIIIIVMFLGRVAPATLLCYLNANKTDTKISYPDAKISLT